MLTWQQDRVATLTPQRGVGTRQTRRLGLRRRRRGGDATTVPEAGRTLAEEDEGPRMLGRRMLDEQADLMLAGRTRVGTRQQVRQAPAAGGCASASGHAMLGARAPQAAAARTAAVVVRCRPGDAAHGPRPMAWLSGREGSSSPGRHVR